MTDFELGVFYQRRTDGAVYRCEQARDIRVLLHSADLIRQLQCERRILSRNLSIDDWVRIADDEEAPHRESYSRDIAQEFGAEIDVIDAIYRRQYHFDPYMAGVSDGEIRLRLQIIADHMLRYDEDGAPHLITDCLDYWRRKAEEIVEEVRDSSRDGFTTTPPNAPHVRIVSVSKDLSDEVGQEEFAPWGRLPQLPTNSRLNLYKFDKYVHLKKTYDEGVIRVSPAASYSDPSLNRARRDPNEGRLILRPWKSGFPMVFRNTDDKVVLDTSADRDEQIAVELGGDVPFFAWCCSEVFEPRLFVDFQADACLVIRDHEVFAKRLNSALLKKYPKMPGMYAKAVRYYDPLLPDHDLKDMLESPLAWAFFKDWQYTYQAEYRFVWPSKPGSILERVDVCLGPLGDICDLVKLEPPVAKKA